MACALVIGMLDVGSAVSAEQSQCGPRAELIKVLADKYQESQRALGLINDKTMMEVYTSPKGTWTMIISNGDGQTCVVAAGESWDEVPVRLAGPYS